jgi:hypothetical protein
MDRFLDFLVEAMGNLVPMVIVGIWGYRLFKKQSLHTLRLQLFAEMMSHRNWVTGEAFSAALNRAMALFFDDPKVVRSVRELVGAKEQSDKNARLVAVFRSIADNLEISNQTLTDNDFLTAFNVRDHGFVLSITPASFNGQPQVMLQATSEAPGDLPKILATMDAQGVEYLISEIRSKFEIAKQQTNVRR